MFQNIKNKIQMSAIVAPIYAQTENEIIIGTNNGPFKNLENLNAGGIVSGAISLVLIVVALVFFFILVFGGLRWVTSGGDEKKVGEARAGITNALIGLAIVFAAWAIMKLIQTVFGIDILGNLSIPSFQ